MTDRWSRILRCSPRSPMSTADTATTMPIARAVCRALPRRRGASARGIVRSRREAFPRRQRLWPRHGTLRGNSGDLSVWRGSCSSLVHRHASNPHDAPGVRGPSAALQPGVPGRRKRPGMARRGAEWTLSAGLGNHRSRQSLAGRARPGLLPPLRRRLQSCRGGRRRQHPCGRAVSRGPSARTGVDSHPRHAAIGKTGPGRGRRSKWAVGRLASDTPRSHGRHARRGAVGRRHDALRHSEISPSSRGARRRDPANRRGRRPRST